MRGIIVGSAMACVLVAGCGDASTPTNATSSSTVAQTTTSPAMTIHDWDENALVDLQAVSDSLHQTGQAMINTDLGLMRIGCTNLRSAIDKLERKLPTPDDQATDALHDSIDDWRSLSQLCMTLGASSTDAEFNQMSTYLHDGEAHRQTAYDRLGLQVS